MNAKPGVAALAGFLFALPFAAMNAIVANRVEPFFSLIRPGPHTSAHEIALLVFVILLLPAGAYVALRPVLRKGPDGKRRFHVVNGGAAAILLLVFGTLSFTLGSEIYRCEILRFPYCD